MSEVYRIVSLRLFYLFFICLPNYRLYIYIYLRPFFTILIITHFTNCIQFFFFVSKDSEMYAHEINMHIFYRCVLICSKYQQKTTLLEIIAQNNSITLSQRKVWIKKNLHAIFCIIFVICRIVLYF